MSWGVGVVQEEIYKGSGYRSGKPNRDLYYILPHKVMLDSRRILMSWGVGVVQEM